MPVVLVLAVPAMIAVGVTGYYLIAIAKLVDTALGVANLVDTGLALATVERMFNPDRKDHHWGKRKLKRDQ